MTLEYDSIIIARDSDNLLYYYNINTKRKLYIDRERNGEKYQGGDICLLDHNNMIRYDNNGIKLINTNKKILQKIDMNISKLAYIKSTKYLFLTQLITNNIKIFKYQDNQLIENDKFPNLRLIMVIDNYILSDEGDNDYKIYNLDNSDIITSLSVSNCIKTSVSPNNTILFLINSRKGIYFREWCLRRMKFIRIFQTFIYDTDGYFITHNQKDKENYYIFGKTYSNIFCMLDTLTLINYSISWNEHKIEMKKMINKKHLICNIVTICNLGNNKIIIEPYISLKYIVFDFIDQTMKEINGIYNELKPKMLSKNKFIIDNRMIDLQTNKIEDFPYTFIDLLDFILKEQKDDMQKLILEIFKGTLIVDNIKKIIAEFL